MVTNGMSMFMDDKCSDNSVAVKVSLLIKFILGSIIPYQIKKIC